MHLDEDSPIGYYISLSSSLYISICELFAMNKEFRLVDIVSYNFY